MLNAPGLRIISITQELGVVQVPPGDNVTNYPLGSKLKVVPQHSCLAAACFPKFTVIDNEENFNIVGEWETAPREW